jgi:hypothetical protein
MPSDDKAIAEVVEQLKNAIREILGEAPSQMFLSRVDKTLDEGAADKVSLVQACGKVEKMVHLFIGVDEAKVIGSRCGEILRKLG